MAPTTIKQSGRPFQKELLLQKELEEDRSTRKALEAKMNAFIAESSKSQRQVTPVTQVVSEEAHALCRQDSLVVKCVHNCDLCQKRY